MIDFGANPKHTTESRKMDTLHRGKAHPSIARVAENEVHFQPKAREEWRIVRTSQLAVLTGV